VLFIFRAGVGLKVLKLAPILHDAAEIDAIVAEEAFGAREKSPTAARIE
jgi:hypothetical protein